MSPRRPAHGLLLALVSMPALAVAACQVSLPGSQSPPPTVAPVSGSPLAAADAKVYSGNYDQAETASPPLVCLDWEDLEVSDYLKAAGKQPSEWVVLARTPAALKKVRDHGPWQETHGRAGLWRLIIPA